MANYTLIGDGDIVFGTTEVGYTTIGEIQSGGQKKGGDMLELKNRYGNTFVVIFFNEADECTIEAIFDTDYTLPARGDLIDIMSLEDVIVLDWELKWEQGKEKRVSLTCKKWEHVVTA